MTTPELATDTRHGRRYAWKVEGETSPRTYDGVTTLLNELSKPALPQWYAGQAAGYAVGNWDELSARMADGKEREVYDDIRAAAGRNRDRAAERGSLLHRSVPNVAGLGKAAIAERLAECSEELYDHTVADLVPPVLEYLGQLDTVLYQEATCFNETMGYAGTFDLMGKVGDCIYLVDWKTGKSVYREAALQLALYSLCNTVAVRTPEGLWRKDRMPHADLGHVVHIRPGKLELYEVVLTDPELQNAALRVVQIAQWRRSPRNWYQRHLRNLDRQKGK